MPSFCTPRYWPTHLLFGIARLVAHLPYAWLIQCGRAIGWVLYKSSSQRAQIVRINLQLCFPQLSHAEREALVLQNLMSMGIGVMEMAMLWFTPNRNWGAMFEIQGTEHIQAVQQQGKGCLLLTFHLTCSEIGCGFIGQSVNIGGLYRKSENLLIEKIMVQSRSRFVHPIAREATREAVKWIKNKGFLWYVPDQDFGRQNSVFVPFFGIPAATLTATTRFVKLTGAPVLPMTQERIAGNKIRIVIHPPLESIGEHPERDAATINQFLETYVRAHPADYLWAHRRFKTRPNEEDDSFYPVKIKTCITPLRFKYLVENAKDAELNGDQIEKVKHHQFIIHVKYRQKNHSWSYKRDLKRFAKSLPPEIHNNHTYQFNGKIGYCEAKQCDLIFLERI